MAIAVKTRVRDFLPLVALKIFFQQPILCTVHRVYVICILATIQLGKPSEKKTAKFMTTC